jgi:aspartyl-tRNA(Asn)/glutamyl-tRNA(Gln) amidotransferase subunit C
MQDEAAAGSGISMEHLARLARIELSDDEKLSLGRDLSAIIDYMRILSEIDTDGVEPMEHVLGLTNIMRSDTPAPSSDRDELLACAPSAEDGFYDVPIAVEQ